MNKGENDCIFCKIVQGEILADKVYEDEYTIAFLDIHPKAPGHTLLIPKEHHRWFLDMPDTLYNKVFESVKKVGEELKEKHKADYVRLGIVGTDVGHVHIHLLPLHLEPKIKINLDTV